MRAVRTAIIANWQLFMAAYAVTLLLELTFGWAGLSIAFGLVFALRHRLLAYSRGKRLGLRFIEAWYFDDGVLDRIEPANASDAGRRA